MTIRPSRKSDRTAVNSHRQALAKRQRELLQRRHLLLENLEDRRVMAAGPDLAGIQPNNGSLLVNDAILKVAPRDLTFNFSNEVPERLDASTLNTLGAQSSIRLIRAGFDGSFNDTNNVFVNPGFIGVGDTGFEVVMRFAEPLPDDRYRVVIIGNGGSNVALRDQAGNLFNDGNNFSLEFELDLGAQITAIVPQPVVRNASGQLTQQTRNIDVYFNNDTLTTASAQNVDFYQLIITENTSTPVDDLKPGNIHKPTAVVYNAAQNKATLTFAQNLAALNPNNFALRLRIGTNETLDGTTYTPIAANDPATTFAGARNVGTLTGTKVYTDAVSAKQYDIQWPGGNDDPGHRDNPHEFHIPDGATDGTGISVQYYNFRKNIGSISDGQGGSQPAFNLITENQKQRAREIFDLYSRYSGIQFIESQDRGIIVATGDLRVVDPDILSAPGGIAGLGGGGIAIMDAAENWDDLYGQNWFQVGMHEIGHALGLGHAYDLPNLTIQGGDGNLAVTPGAEPVFPGDADITHMRRLYRPEAQDIDMYRFVIAAGQTGVFTAETFAERLQNSSVLDTYLRLYRQGPSGNEVIAVNDDYFTKDSMIELELGAGTYYIGVSAKGNDQYNPITADSGMNGTSEGEYRLRFNFRPTVSASRSIVDLTGTPLDGNNDGTPGGVHDFWFKTAAAQPAGATTHSVPRTLFVDKSASVGGNGSLATPFNNIQLALAEATVAGDIVRIVGNGGADNDINTLGDNLAYQIGFDLIDVSQPLPDGSALVVPKDVTVMVDAGAIFQMNRSRIQVGSTQTSVGTDRSGGALQVLGTPNTRVQFTSYRDQSIGRDTESLNTSPAAGNWGGILFRNDQDRADGRFDWEEHGIFLNYVNYADIRYGGGQVNLDGGTQTDVRAIHMIDARPTVTNNLITRNAGAAMSASPNSFEETTFREPRYQPDGTYARSFNVDYTRIGPDIHGNRLVSVENGLTFFNSINGLFVSAPTAFGSATQDALTVAGRFDDLDIVHVISENLDINGTPSGPLLEGAIPSPADPTIDSGKPPVELIRMSRQPGGDLAAGTYHYRVVYVDLFGNEGRASDVISINVGSDNSAVQLSQLPDLPDKSKGIDSDYGTRFVARRIYRQDSDGVWRFVDQVPATVETFVDRGAAPTFIRVLNQGLLNSNLGESRFLNRARTDASLKIDPNVVVKFDRSRIEVKMGATLIAEGLDGQEVIFTSLSDDRYGAGGTFDTRSDANNNPPDAGEWGGIFARANSRISIDNANIFYAGGVTRLEGGSAGVNAIEIHQADARIANSLIQFNADGTGNSASPDRFGRGFNAQGAIFVRGAQPVIVNNIIRDNLGAAININVNALNSDRVVDLGRQSGLVDRVPGHLDNHGPLVSGNRLGNNGPTDGSQGANGMIVRGGMLTTESVWDDTDIVHILLERVSVTDFHTFGGLRLESSPKESLVIKALTISDTSPAGFYVNGLPREIEDRAGGILQVLGQPGFPVVMTSLNDDTVGAGFQPDRSPSTDTNNNGDGSGGGGGGGGLPTGPEVNNGTLIDNDVDPQIPGFFSFDAVAGGEEGSGGGVTAQGLTQLFQDQDFIFDFLNFVDVGSDGNAVDLGSTTVTQPPTLQTNPLEDIVVSEGTFQGANGVITWRAESSFVDGQSRLNNKITFSSPQPLGNLRFINYLDEDISNFTDDILYLTGTPGQDDFRAFTLDGPERVGFAQGGIVTPAAGALENASYAGWAADQFNQLQTAITGTGTTYSVPGNIDTADLPAFTDPSLGTVFGPNDVTSAFAWNVDPTATTATITSFLELVASDPASAGQPGEWEGITIDKYAHDRNVDTILEQEDITLVAPGSNSTPITSQELGALAPFEKGGDENRRLGFAVHGTLNAKNDIDVYSFRADAGTEVWIDIDRTHHALDTVVELIDADGFVLARSNNSHLEDKGTEGLFGSALLQRRTSPFEGRDFYTTNPKDAGMRVVLPGPNGTNSAYFVRIRSSSNTIGNVNNGLTEGAYQFQVRLQEKDEIGGTVIRYGDIRNAETGIKVLGQVIHSPLTGEHTDVERNGGTNNDLPSAQNVGNVTGVDRGATSIAGNLAGAGDVDWYQFNLDFTGLQGPSAAALATEALYSMIFDIDYADGFGRPNTMLSVFDAQGRLILSSRDSNIADDRPAPLSAANIEDLLRGSAGSGDAYIGPAYLPAGLVQGGTTTYYVAVSSDSQMPAQWGQIFQRVPTNPFARFEPVNSTRRIVEDHIGEGAGAGAPRGTGQLADVQLLFDNDSFVPFSLSDVPLYIQRATTRNNISSADLVTVDPFSGGDETFVGTQFDELRDIAFRADRQMFSYSQDIADLQDGVIDDEDSGHFYQISTANGAATDLGDDGILTFERTPQAGGGFALDRAHLFNNARIGYGIQFEALTFGNLRFNPEGERLFAVGNRGEEYFANGQINADISPRRNLLWQMNTQTGAPVVPGGVGGVAPNFFGALASHFEMGEIVTSPQIIAVDATTRGLSGLANFDIQDGTKFTVSNGGGDVTFEFDAGFEVRQTVDVPNGDTIRDGNFFILDRDTNANNNNEVWYQFDTGLVISINAFSTAIPDGETISINDNAGNTLTFEFERGGGQINPNAVLVDIRGSLNPIGVAGILSDAINGATGANFTVSSSVSSNRVSMVNDTNVGLSAGLNTSSLVSISGADGLAPILQAVPGSQIVDGQQFVIARRNQPQRVFEFDSVGGVSPGATAVPFSPLDTSTQVAASMESALVTALGTSISVQRVGDRVVVSGQGPSNSTTLYQQNTSPIVDMTQVVEIYGIDVEESDAAGTLDGLGLPVPPGPGIGEKVRDRVHATSNFLVGTDLDRLNFARPVDPANPLLPNRIPTRRVEFDGVPEWALQTGSALGTAAGNVAIGFLAEDDALDIALRIQQALNNTFNDPSFSIASGTRVYLDGQSNFSSFDAPLTAQGEGPGGFVTGITILPGDPDTTIDDVMYAISDAGGLYIVDADTVDNSNLPNIDPRKVLQVTTTYVDSSRAELAGLSFQALTRGPQNVEGGRYKDMLFGVTTNGRLYAFNTAGQLQPIFANGATNIQLRYRDPLNPDVSIPVTNARGIAFGELDRNPWQFTPHDDPVFNQFRQRDQGHGTLPTHDGAVVPPQARPFEEESHLGHGSLFFGNEGRNGTYDFNGGAHGSIVSNEFSLEGYSSADQPVLYYTYFLASEELYDPDNGNQIRDAVKVYISGTDPENGFNSGDWKLVAGDQEERFTDRPVGQAPSRALGSRMFDTTGNWRQVRIPLGEYAGLENLRLRFDFSTAADMNLGDIDTTGEELRAVAGKYITDGQSFVVDNQRFEFNSGYTIVAPAGASLVDGNTITITKNFNVPGGGAQQKSVTFEFDNNSGVAAGNVTIPFSGFETAADVARLLVNAIKANFGQVDGNTGRTQTDSVIPRWIGDNRVNVNFASQVTATAASAIVLQGSNSVSAGNVSVPIHRNMTREEVAAVIDGLLESYFHNQTVVVRGTGVDYRDGDTFTIDVGAQSFDFEFETGYVLNVPAGGGIPTINPHVNDGDTIRLRRVVNGNLLGDFTFEFDNNNSLIGATNIRVPFGNGDIQIEIADAFADAVRTGLTTTQKNALGIFSAPEVISGGRVHLGGGAGLTLTTSAPGSFSTTGTPGTQAGFTPVFHVPSMFTTAAEVAADITRALNVGFGSSGFTAFNDPNDPARVELRGVTVQNFVLAKNPANLQLTLENANDIVKTHQDLIRIIGHRITDRGPLGLDTSLEGDLQGIGVGYESNVRGQNNAFEGLYLDDFIIGFAERGEMVTGATNDSGFINNPFLQPNQIVAGDYQLEMRRGPDYSFPTPLGSAPSFDTNDRQNESHTIVAPAGADIADGKTFTLGDGINKLTFEFDLVGDNRVTSGNVRIPYTVNDRPEVIGRAMRDAINGPAAQSVLKVSAQLSDGSLFGQQTSGDFPGRLSNDVRVNLIGDVTVQPNGVSAAEANDLKSQARPLNFSTSGTQIVSATIGDNRAKAANQDVDLFQMNLAAGQRVFIDVDASQFGSGLNSRIRVFNAAGGQLAVNDDAGAPGERGNTTDSYVVFTAPAAGTYYIGVSGAGNRTYNINDGTGNLSGGSTGSYQLEVSLSQSSSTEADLRDVLNTFGSVPTNRSRNFNVFLEAGVTYYFNVDAATTGSTLNSNLQLFTSGGTLLSSNDNGSAPGETPNGDSYLEFTPATNGTYRINVSGIGGTSGHFRLQVSATPPSAIDAQITRQDYGDENLFRDQGQLILDGNRISNSATWGIQIDEGARDNGAGPHQGPVRSLRELNTTRLVPGVVVSNNVIYNNGIGGIQYSGTLNSLGDELGSVPYGRIINNTLFGHGGNLTGPGTGSDVGIQVDQNASPTLMNNIVANFTTGISVAPDSQTTVLLGQVYQGNLSNASSNVGVGANAFTLSNTAPLFVNPGVGNFYLAAGSLAIDSSIDSLLDRTAMQTVRNPLGIPPSPIIAPSRDSTGSLRVDDPDVDSPGGSGENVFKDRGAIDRVDFAGPTSVLLNPRDNDDQGLDGDPTPTRVVLGNTTLFTFEIQLNDTGIGIDDDSVISAAVLVEETVGNVTRTLTAGADYVFSYDRTNNRIILRPIGGIWPLNRNYRITLDNSVTDGSPAVAIRDTAANLLSPNRSNGTAVYEIFLGTAVDWGDAPASYGTTQAGNGASHQIRGLLKLGTNVSADTNGSPSANADADTFDDGLIRYDISPGIQSSITVLGQGTGVLDAWLDINKDGDFLDAGEKIISGVTIGNNQNRTLNFTFGNSSTPKGDTFLRLRYTGSGIDSPLGQATDGEVEDYEVTVRGAKFQNPNNRFDVDNNGFVQPRDALIIVNVIANYDANGDGTVNPNTELPPELQNPPPYYDVDGNGLIQRIDALLVVNQINSAGSSTATSSPTQFASSSVVYEQVAAPSPDDAVDALFASIGSAAPVLGLGGTTSYRLNSSAPVTLARAATVADADSANFGGGQLRVHIASGADIANRLEIGGVFTLSGSRIMMGDKAIGWINSNGGVGKTDLRITFYASATAPIVQEVVRSIRFRTAGGTSLTARSIEFSLTDGDGGLSEVKTKIVNVLR